MAQPTPYPKKDLARLIDISPKQLSRFCLARGFWLPNDRRKVIPPHEAEQIIEAYITNPHINAQL